VTSLHITGKNNKMLKVTSEIEKELENLLGERVIYANEPRYFFKFLPNQTQPSVVIECHTIEDIVKAIQFAKKYDLICAIRNGELSILGDELVDSGMLIDIPQFIEIDNIFDETGIALT